jgi:hypothetical protein
MTVFNKRQSTAIEYCAAWRLRHAISQMESGAPPTGKPSEGRAPKEFWIQWAELPRRTVSVDPEICLYGARMTVDDMITNSDVFLNGLKNL